MEPTNDIQSNQFFINIERFNQRKDYQTIETLKKLISENITIIIDSLDVTNVNFREKIFTFAENITKTFKNNSKAIELAGEIRGYANTAFFDNPDVTKKIYSYFLPKDMNRSTNIEESDEVMPIRLVSKSFKENMEDAIDDWRQKELISLISLKIKTADEAITYIKNHRLLKVNFLEIPNVQEKHLLELAMSNVHTLIIERKDCVTVDKWPEMKSLESLSILGEEFDIVISNAKKFPKLKMIKISHSGMTSIKTDQDVIKILDAFPRINKLSLEFSEIVGDAFAGKTYPLIEILNLDSSDVTDEEIAKIIHSFPSLRLINLGWTKITEYSLNTLLKNCPNLEVISIYMNKMDGKGFAELNQTNSKVRVINFSHNNSIGKEKLPENTLIKLLEACPNLEEISFEATEVDWEGLISTDKTFLNLKMISLKNTKITNKGLANILKICPNLEKISLQGTKISSEGWLLNVEEMPNLQKIDLSGTKLNNKDLIELLEKAPNLSEIYIIETNIIGKDLANIGKTFSSPHYIHISRDKLTDEDVRGFIKFFPRFRDIEIYGKGALDYRIDL